jgi:Protein of unknown function (DUF2797).
MPNRDIYTDYVRGDSTVKTSKKQLFSVYLVQISQETKVGVTQTKRIHNRWAEQGAQLASEIKRGTTSEEALNLEEKISKLPEISQRISKSKKIGEPDEELFKKHLAQVQEKVPQLEISKTEKIGKQTGFPPVKCSEFKRRGRIPSPIKSVRGQIISNNKVCLAISTGKVITSSKQQTLTGLK